MATRNKTSKLYQQAAVEKDNFPDKTIKDIAEEYGISRTSLNGYIIGFEFGKEYAEAIDDKISKSFGSRENTIYKNQTKTRYQRKDLLKDLRDEAFFELFVESYVIPNLKPIPLKKYVPVKKICLKNKKQSFFFSDIHWKDKENSYEDVKRLERLVLENYNGSGTINLSFLGDAIENEIRISSLLERTETVMEQTVNVAKALSEVLVGIRANLDEKVKMNVPLLEGNHDSTNRLAGNSARDNHKETVITAIKAILEANLKNYDITFPKQDTFNYYKSDNIYLEHGDTFRGKPEVYYTTKMNQDPEKFKGVNHIFLGHSHKFEDFIVKGTDMRYTYVPTLKTWNSQWEIDNNQIGTSGIVSMNNEGILTFIPVRK